MDASTFARVLHVFRTARGYATIADVSYPVARLADQRSLSSKHYVQAIPRRSYL